METMPEDYKVPKDRSIKMKIPPLEVICIEKGKGADVYIEMGEAEFRTLYEELVDLLGKTDANNVMATIDEYGIVIGN